MSSLSSDEYPPPYTGALDIHQRGLLHTMAATFGHWFVTNEPATLVNRWPRREGFSTVLAEWIVQQQQLGHRVAFFGIGTRSAQNMQTLVLARGGEPFTVCEGGIHPLLRGGAQTRSMSQLKAQTTFAVQESLHMDAVDPEGRPIYTGVRVFRL